MSKELIQPNESVTMSVSEMAQSLGKGYRTVYRWVHDFVCQNGTSVCQNGTSVCQNGTSVSRESRFTWNEWKVFLSSHLSEVELAGLDSLCQNGTSPQSSEDLVRSIVQSAVDAATKPLLETIETLKADNHRLQLQLDRLLSLPSNSSVRSSTASLPAPSTDTSDIIPALPLKSFCNYMGIDISVIINRRCLPGVSCWYIRDEFPLHSKQRAREYVQWVLTRVFDSAHRYEWFQQHPSWASRSGVEI